MSTFKSGRVWIANTAVIFVAVVVDVLFKRMYSGIMPTLGFYPWAH